MCWMSPSAFSRISAIEYGNYYTSYKYGYDKQCWAFFTTIWRLLCECCKIERKWKWHIRNMHSTYQYLYYYWYLSDSFSYTCFPIRCLTRVYFVHTANGTCNENKSCISCLQAIQWNKYQSRHIAKQHWNTCLSYAMYLNPNRNIVWDKDGDIVVWFQCNKVASELLTLLR